MFNWLRQAAGAVGNLFNQGSRYVGNTFNSADRQRRLWEQQARQAAPQVQRQVQQQVQQLPKPPQVDFSAVIKNLQALRNQPQVNNAIRAANPINQFKSQANAINQSIVKPLNQYGQNQVMKQYGLNQQQLTDLQNKSVVDRLKFGITRPAQLNKENPAQAIMGSPLNPLGGQAAFQVFNQSPVNIPKPDLTKMADDASASIARSRVGKNPIIGFAGENIVRPIIKSGARYADVTTGQEKYQPGVKGLAQLGTDTFNIGSTVYTPLGAGKLAQGGKVARKAALGAFGRGALAGGGISALNQYSDTGKIDPANVALSALLGGAGNTLLPVAFGGLGRTGTKALAGLRKPDLNAQISVPSLAEKGRLLQQGYKNVEVVVPNRPVNALQTRYEQLRNAGATNTPEYRAVQQELQKAGIGLPDTPRPITQNAPKNNIDPLLNEARKYKSAEEFVNSQVSRPKTTNNVWQDTLPSGTRPDSIKKITDSGGNPLYHDTSADNVLSILDSGQIKASQAPFSSMAGQGKRVSTTRNFDNYSRYNKSPYRLVIDESKTGQRAIPDNREEFESIFRKGVSTKAVNSIAIDTTNPALLTDIRSGKLKSVIESAKKKGIAIEPFEGKVLPNEGANAEVQTMTSRAFSEAFPEYKTRISQLTNLYNQAHAEAPAPQTPKPEAPDPTAALKQEALKYKSAEEFVKAQGTRTGVEVRDKIGTKLQDPYTAEYLPTNSDGTITLYHSTTKEGAEKIKQSGIFGSKTEGGDIYFTTNKKGYGGIGKDKDVVLAFNVDPKKIKFDDVYRGELHLKGNNTDIGGIKPVVIKTKSQLEEIWNKANKNVDIEPLIQEAKKYKSAEEFVKAQRGNPVEPSNFLGDKIYKTKLDDLLPESSPYRGIDGDIRLSDQSGSYTVKDTSPTSRVNMFIGKEGWDQVGDTRVLNENGMRTVAHELEHKKQMLEGRAEASPHDILDYIDSPLEKEARDAEKSVVTDKQLTDLYNQATKNKPIYELAPKPDAQLPVKANRGLIESVKESPMTKASLRNALESEQYTVLPNKVTMDQAVKTINKNPQAALNEVLSTKPRTAQLNAQGLILAEKAQKRGDFETAQKIFQAMAPGNTKEGQAIQILSVWSKTKPEGVVKYAQKVVDDANNTLIVAGKNPSITLSAEKAAGFRKQAEAIAKMPEGKDKLIATQKMLNEIHQQIPASIAEKAQSLLYYAQLLNPKTAVRNIIGNTGFALSETAKDIVGAPIDATLTGVRRLLGQDAQRSIYLPNPIKQIRAGLAGGAEAAKEAKVGVNLSGLEGQLQIGNKQPAFRNPVGRGLDKAMQFELSVPDRTFYTSRYQQTLDNLMKGAKVSKPTKEMLDIADYDAKYATFQDDSRAAQAFVAFKNGLNKIAGTKDGTFGAGNFVINYPKTPGNLLARGIDYSPAGFVKSTLEIAKPLFGQGPFNQKKFIDSFSRALVGTGSLVGTGALLHKAGIITGAPSKDKDVNAQDKATGLGAYRINVDALRRYVTSGFKPQKLEDGDRTLTYDWFQPAAIGISMGANIDETQASDKGAVGKLVSMLGTGGASVAAGAETLANQPLVQGLTKLTGNGGGITQGVLAIAQGVPASFVPTLLNQVNQLIDNTSRSTYDPNPAVQGINMVKAKIPGLAQTLQPQVNPEGQNNERYQNGSNNPFNVFLNPAFMGTYNADNVQKEITRLENSTGQTSQYPSIIKNTQKVNGQDVQLSPQQVTDMQRVQGQLTKEAYAKIMSDPAYSRLSDTDKVKKLQNIITQANQIARSQVLSDQNGRNQITVSAEGKKPKVAKAPKAKKPKKGRTARKGRSTKVAKLPSIRLSAPRKVATAKVAKLRAPKVRYQRLAKISKTPKIKV